MVKNFEGVIFFCNRPSSGFFFCTHHIGRKQFYLLLTVLRMITCWLWAYCRFCVYIENAWTLKWHVMIYCAQVFCLIFLFKCVRKVFTFSVAGSSSSLTSRRAGSRSGSNLIRISLAPIQALVYFSGASSHARSLCGKQEDAVEKHDHFLFSVRVMSKPIRVMHLRNWSVCYISEKFQFLKSNSALLLRISNSVIRKYYSLLFHVVFPNITNLNVQCLEFLRKFAKIEKC